MRINAISNNQIKANNNKQSNNISFNGMTKTSIKEAGQKRSPKIVSLSLVVIAVSVIVSNFFKEKNSMMEKERTINEIGDLINSENYIRDSLEVKDYTNDGVLDFKIVDKDGKKVVYDAKKNELLEYITTLQEMK